MNYYYMNYFDKYIKYKIKYTNLIGGAYNVKNEIKKNYSKFIEQLYKNIENWSLPKNYVYYQTKKILDNNNNLEEHNQEIINYYSNLIIKIDPTDNKYCKLIFELFLNNKINLHFLYYNLYYYLHIFNILDINEQKIKEKKKILIQELENEKTEVNKINNSPEFKTLLAIKIEIIKNISEEKNKQLSKITKQENSELFSIKQELERIDIELKAVEIQKKTLIANKKELVELNDSTVIELIGQKEEEIKSFQRIIEQFKTRKKELINNKDLITKRELTINEQIVEYEQVLKELDKQIDEKYMEYHQYKTLHDQLEIWNKLENIFTSSSSNYTIDDLLFFYINLLDFTHNNLFQDELINLNIIQRPLECIGTQLNLNISEHLCDIYMNLDNIKNKLLELNRYNYLNNSNSYFDLITNQEDFNNYYQKLGKQIDKRIKDSPILPFDNLCNINQLITIFKYYTQKVSKIKYLLFSYIGLENNEIYINKNVLIIKPRDMISSIFYGSSTTKWCTSAKKKNNYKEYSSRNLYMILDLIDGNFKYQLTPKDKDEEEEYQNVLSEDIKLVEVYYKYPNLFEIFDTDDENIQMAIFIYDSDIKSNILSLSLTNENFKERYHIYNIEDKGKLVKNILVYDYLKIINLEEIDISILEVNDLKKLIKHCIKNTEINLFKLFIQNIKIDKFNILFTLFNILELNSMDILELYYDKMKEFNFDICHNIINSDGNTPLMYIINRKSNKDIINFIFENGYDGNINIQNKCGNTCLHIALIFYRELQIINLILSQNPDINIQNSSGETPLYKAIDNNELIILLLSQNPKPNLDLQGYRGMTVLHRAIYKQDIELVTILLEQNPKPNLDIENIDGDTALHLAVYSKNKDLVSLLVLQNPQPKILNNKKGKNVYSILIDHKDYENIEDILSILS